VGDAIPFSELALESPDQRPFGTRERAALDRLDEQIDFLGSKRSARGFLVGRQRLWPLV
jgi:hypothetical protein